jgi:2-dehydro-3-deoxyphosphogluconate aldolase / (4S)-4-hydroxy-2-oxoglutarate aldolase
MIDLGRIVPVIVLDRAQDAERLGPALAAGGLRAAEATFRTEAAAEAIRILSEQPDLCVGAGTVLTEDQVDRAAEAGARFVVSPGFSPRVVAHCARRGLPVLPGAATWWPSTMRKTGPFVSCSNRLQKSMKTVAVNLPSNAAKRRAPWP